MAALAAALSTGQHTRTPEELSWDAEGTLNSAAWQPAPLAGHAPPGAAAGAPGRGKQPASRSGGAVLRQLQSSAGPSCPRDSRRQSRAEWAWGGTGLRAPPPAGPESARRARARALCIKPSSPAKVEEVGLPPGWEAGGSPAPVVFREREWVAGAEGGVRPPTPGRALPRQNRAGSPRLFPPPDIGLSPSILPGDCGEWGSSVVPRTWEEHSVPQGPGPWGWGRAPTQPEPAIPEESLPASGARWPQASGRPGRRSLSASGCCWPAGSPQVRGRDPEGKVEFCQAKRRARDPIPSDSARAGCGSGPAAAPGGS